MPTPQDILAAGPAGESTPIADVVGQTFTVVGYSNASGPNGSFIVMDVVTAEGEEERVRTGAAAVVQKLEQLRDADAFPIEVEVTTFTSKFGTPGYDLTNPS